jgi:DnaJ-class molecular chaperone
MAKRDYYDVLGITRTATDDEIRSAYRRLARKYHPDLNPGNPQAEQQFKELGGAYEVLSDPKKRTAYDRFGPDGVNLGAGGPGPGGPGPGGAGQRYTWSGGDSPFDDVAFEAFAGSGGESTGLFEELFSRLGGQSGSRSGGRQGPRQGRRPRPPARGGDIESDITIPFDQSIRGAETSLALQRPSEDGGPRPERLTVRIPPGVRDGQQLRLRGRGMPGPSGGPPGDLYLKIHVDPHPLFRRDGKDIYMDLPITVSEAALGATVDVPTISGRSSVRIPPGTSSGTRLRLRGQGVASPAGPTGTAAGDQYCVIRIVPPKSLDDRERQLFEELRTRTHDNPRSGELWNP